MVEDHEIEHHYPHVREHPREEYMPVYRDANPVDLRPFPDIVYNTPENEQLMMHLMGTAQVILLVVLGFTWYHARLFHREQRNILYMRRAFKENEKEKGSRSNRSRGNTSGGSKDTMDEDSNWLTISFDWVYKMFNFKAKKSTQQDGMSAKARFLSFFQRNTTKIPKKAG